MAKMNNIISGKSCVITGGFGGIGLEICRALLTNGLKNLAIFDLNDDRNQTAKLNDEFKDANVIFKQTDVLNRDDIEKNLVFAKNKFKQLNIIVNCAGIFCDTEIEMTIGINTCGTIYSSLAALDLMSHKKGGEGGYIVNIASVAGLVPTYMMPVYVGSKFAVVGFSRSMADKHFYEKTGVKFMIICPNMTSTGLVANFKAKVLYPKEDGEKIHNDITQRPTQSPQSVAECVIQAINSDKNGSIWYSANEKNVEVIPDESYLGIKPQPQREN